MSQLKAFRWFGGKNRHDIQPWLLSQLPPGATRQELIFCNYQLGEE